METNPDFRNNIFCKECGGKCCKRMSCHLSPDDIKCEITYEALKQLLETGDYSIDWWECYEKEDGDEVDGYFIRVRNKNGGIVDPSWGGECSLLTDGGCSLHFEERPKGGRMLLCKTTHDGECISHYPKKDCADDWIIYYEILWKLRHYFEWGGT